MHSTVWGGSRGLRAGSDIFPCSEFHHIPFLVLPPHHLLCESIDTRIWQQKSRVANIQ